MFGVRGAAIAFHGGVVSGDELRRDHALEQQSVVSLSRDCLPALPCGGQELSKITEDSLARAPARVHEAKLWVHHSNIRPETLVRWHRTQS